jgi:hypothetical protein
LAILHKIDDKCHKVKNGGICIITGQTDILSFSNLLNLFLSNRRIFKLPSFFTNAHFAAIIKALQMQIRIAVSSFQDRLAAAFLSVPVRVKIIGIMMLPVLILGGALTYWIRTGLSDWLSYLLTDERVQIAMRNGSRSVLIVTCFQRSSPSCWHRC